MGKGSRPRVVPFGAETGQALDRYLRVRALHPYANSNQLLLGLRGPMTSDGAREVLNVRSAQAGWTACTHTGSGTPSPTAGWPAAGRSAT
jgi:site-specific recombinase XerD